MPQRKKEQSTQQPRQRTGGREGGRGVGGHPRRTRFGASGVRALVRWGRLALLGLAFSAAVAQAAPLAYITNRGDDTVSVIDTADNSIVATVGVGSRPFGVAVTPDGALVYVTNFNSDTVSVLATAPHEVVATVGVGITPFGVAVTPDGAFVYVANFSSHTVSVLATATNTVSTTVPVGRGPVAFGQFIGPQGGYDFAGFFPPVENPPIVNRLTAGQAVPVNFSLGGEQGLDIFAAGFPQSQPIACDTAAPVDEVEATVSAGHSGLQYDAATDLYTYVWKTTKSWKGSCRQLTLRLDDGSTHRLLFQFK